VSNYSVFRRWRWVDRVWGPYVMVASPGMPYVDVTSAIGREWRPAGRLAAIEADPVTLWYVLELPDGGMQRIVGSTYPLTWQPESGWRAVAS